MKVSFDFDSCLDNYKVQLYAEQLINRGFDVWICTSRKSTENAPKPDWNDDIFEVADSLNIPIKNIIFTNLVLKAYFIKNKHFIFHLDDYILDVEEINKTQATTGILYHKRIDWKNKCEEAITEYLNNNK